MYIFIDPSKTLWIDVKKQGDRIAEFGSRVGQGHNDDASAAATLTSFSNKKNFDSMEHAFMNEGDLGGGVYTTAGGAGIGGALVPEDDRDSEWRSKLAVGDLVDACDQSNNWYQVRSSHLTYPPIPLDSMLIFVYHTIGLYR